MVERKTSLSDDQIAFVSGQLRELIYHSDEEMAAAKKQIRKLVSETKPSSLEKLKAALRLRIPSLVNLLEEAIAEEEGGL